MQLNKLVVESWGNSVPVQDFMGWLSALGHETCAKLFMASTYGAKLAKPSFLVHIAIVSIFPVSLAQYLSGPNRW